MKRIETRGVNVANHARDNRDVRDKRAALAGAGMQQRAYSHSDQVGGTRRREADGRWVDREQEPPRPEPQRRPGERETIGQFIARNAVYILSVVAVALIAVLLIFGVRMFADLTQGAPGDDEYVSPYDWSNLDRTDGHYAYVVNGQVKSRLGVDVADYQGYPDWEAAAADGIDFAMIRLGYRGATEGALYLDEYFESNLENARAAGIDCGLYFFSQAISVEEAVEEAEFVLDNLGGRPLEYPIAFDSEVVTSLGATRTIDLSDEELTAIADAFCDRIEQAGYRTMVYGNALDLSSYDIVVMTGRGIWWAEYDVEYPSHYTDIVMWQYTSTGSVAGFDTTVDMNLDLSGV